MYDKAHMSRTQRIMVCLCSVGLLVNASNRASWTDKTCKRGAWVCEDFLSSDQATSFLERLKKHVKEFGESEQRFLVRKADGRGAQFHPPGAPKPDTNVVASAFQLFPQEKGIQTSFCNPDTCNPENALGRDIYTTIKMKLKTLLRDEFVENVLNSEERCDYFKTLCGKDEITPWTEDSEFEIYHIRTMMYRQGEGIYWHTDTDTAQNENRINLSINLMPAQEGTGVFCSSTRTGNETRKADGNIKEACRKDPSKLKKEILRHEMKRGGCVFIPSLVEHSVTKSERATTAKYFPEFARISLVLTIGLKENPREAKLRKVVEENNELRDALRCRENAQ